MKTYTQCSRAFEYMVKQTEVSIIEQVIIAASRKYLYEFRGAEANNSTIYNWKLYKSAMKVVYDNHDLMSGCNLTCDGNCNFCKQARKEQMTTITSKIENIKRIADKLFCKPDSDEYTCITINSFEVVQLFLSKWDAYNNQSEDFECRVFEAGSFEEALDQLENWLNAKEKQNDEKNNKLKQLEKNIIELAVKFITPHHNTIKLASVVNEYLIAKNEK